MNRDSVASAFEQARALVADVKEEPFQAIAFEVVFRRLLDGVGQMPVPFQPGDVGGRMATNVAVGEFLAMTQPGSYSDKVAVIALYYLRVKDEDSITRADIFDALSKARMPRPKNLSDVIAQAVRKGYLMDSEMKSGQKAWKITMTGERYFESNLLSKS